MENFPKTENESKELQCRPMKKPNDLYGNRVPKLDISDKLRILQTELFDRPEDTAFRQKVAKKVYSTTKHVKK